MGFPIAASWPKLLATKRDGKVAWWALAREIVSGKYPATFWKRFGLPLWGALNATAGTVGEFDSGIP